MDIVRADEVAVARYAETLCELMWATGPVSYAYHFAERAVFDALVSRSVRAAGTLFGWDAMHLAMHGDALLGAMVAYEGPQYRERQRALGGLWPALMEAGIVDADDLKGVIERSRRASWLNPVIQPRVWYIHAISVAPEARGKHVGAALIDQAMTDGRAAGCRALELDVLSDNPATGFYRSRGLELLVESRAPEPEAFGVPPEWRMGIDLR